MNRTQNIDPDDGTYGWLGIAVLCILATVIYRVAF